MLIVPYHVDVPMRCPPWMNWTLIGVTVLFFPLCVQAARLTPLGENLMLGGKSWLGIFGHVLVHADLFHLLGNMLFLWVFGNAVCAKLGNLWYPVIYFAIAGLTAVVTYAIDPHPAVGASGAINGIVGMFVVWYLLNEISCWYFFIWAGTGTFSVSSYWMVLLWLAFDIWGVVQGEGNIGYVAHIAGLVIGFLAAVILLATGLVRMDRGERSLLQALSGGKEE